MLGGRLTTLRRKTCILEMYLAKHGDQAVVYVLPYRRYGIADDTIRVYSVPGALQWELELG